MADTYNIYKQCTRCKGTGKIIIDNLPYDPGPPREIDCPRCEGVGKVLWGQMRKEEPED